MKKLLLIFGIIALSSCAQDEAKVRADKEATYFLDENFTLVDAKEEIISDGGTPFKVRTWVINRVIQHSPDTVEQGIVVSKIDANSGDCGCGSSDFAITNELWYSKPVGSTLHFDFIRKNRFFKMPVKHEVVLKAEVQENPYKDIVVGGNMDGKNKIDIELEILRLEREMITLKEQLKTYN